MDESLPKMPIPTPMDHKFVDLARKYGLKIHDASEADAVVQQTFLDGLEHRLPKLSLTELRVRANADFEPWDSEEVIERTFCDVNLLIIAIGEHIGNGLELKEAMEVNGYSTDLVERRFEPLVIETYSSVFDELYGPIWREQLRPVVDAKRRILQAQREAK